MPEAIDASAKHVFVEALELSGADRASYLDIACANDPALRARVAALLSAADTDDAFLRSPTVIAEAPAAIGEGVGSTIGPYRLIQLIGEGGFGSVFMAEQERPVRRRVAFKIIKLGMDTRAVVARFEQERQALAVMDHPNIARVFDAGSTTTGRPYFVMELVGGRPITEYCDQNKLTVEERIDLVTQVCNAVQHAHTKGIIHRDIKPGNVLVSSHDGRPAAKVIDFGIAKATDHSRSRYTLVTEFRQPIGTPEYMSPEQAEASLDIDTRTDVYSLGVLLYELLAGTPPFEPERLRSAAYGEMQRIIREVDPPRPSTRLSQSKDTVASIASMRRTEPGRLGTLLRGELDWIVMRALEKDRARRYQSPGALAADLARYLRGDAVDAAPPNARYRLGKFVRRHKVPFIAGTLILTALLLGTVGTSIGLFRANTAERNARQQAVIAEDNARQARSNARVAESANKLIATMISRADRSKEGGRADITVREVMDTAAHELESRQTQYEPAVASMLAKSIGDTYRQLNLYEPALRMMQLHLDLERQLHTENSADYAEALGDLGELLKLNGNQPGAEAAYEKALAIARPLGDPGLNAVLSVQVNQSVLLSQKGDVAAAEKVLRQTLTDAETHDRTNTTTYATALQNLAAVQYRNGNLADAETLYRRSVTTLQGIGGGSLEEACTTLHNLAALQFARRDLAAAEHTTREELTLARRLYGDKHSVVVDALEPLGIVLSANGDIAGAEAAQQEAVAINRAILNADSPAFANSLRKLGLILVDKGDKAQAEATLSEALTILDKSVALGDSELIFAHYHLASLAAQRGDPAKAQRVLRPSLEAAEKSLPQGVKYEWIRCICSILLGSTMVDQARDQSLPIASRIDLLKQAEPLITPMADRLLEVMAKMGPKTRKAQVPIAMERAASLYEVWNALEPSPDREKLAARYHLRSTDFDQPATK